ncbi:DyP-type peroxidase [Phanerochaete sordida]|uniref:DyP-type peroxidase n=1 Tax=Phanerochaete sordida TaxID=48140 RepID=A0A9P3FW17_9APHY|nr:DyP-type peroxidase [Phanerochaete sordida]
MDVAMTEPLDQRNLQSLSGRSIVPLVPASITRRPEHVAALSLDVQQRLSTESELAPQDGDLPDLENVQGDVIYLFPKKYESFIFFRVKDVRQFKTALNEFKPSSSLDVLRFLHRLGDAKRHARGQRIDIIPVTFYQIAFTRMGMNYMGEKEATGDVRFDQRAMRDDKDYLGDQMEWDAAFNKPNPDPQHGSANRDEGALHGVITTAGSDPVSCAQATEAALKLFGMSIDVILTLEGTIRPAPWAGHEHFGYKDGISQPSLRQLSDPYPGQVQVDPGVIIHGYKGDPLVDDPYATHKRPAWARDGTIMVFRKLQQFVPEFDDYLNRNGKRWKEFSPNGAADDLTDKEGTELWGARMIGRWKSGAPVQLCPVRDSAKVAADPEQNNNFDYHIRDNPKVSPTALTGLYCPFNSHTRKTVPRSLDPYIQQRYLESGMITRAGLPYGPEVTDQERASNETSKDPSKERGLLFISYQSSLDQGFVRQTATFANNDFFPMISMAPTRQGQDTVIGGPPPPKSASAYTEVQFVGTPDSALPRTGDQVNWTLTSRTTGERISVSGFAGVKPPGADNPPGIPQEFFVTSHGGEYFFVPPIKTLKSWANDGRVAAL